MNVRIPSGGVSLGLLLLTGLCLTLSSEAWAHCDTMSGPVIADAQKALETGDVNAVLKWVSADREKEIRELFEKTLQVRRQDKDVQELVDMHFFETLVRVHRAGEGAPYTGLKPADTPVEPGIEAAEQALQEKSGSALIEDMQAELGSRLQERFDRVVEAARHKDDSVAAGRAYVEAYVEYIHYVEGLHLALTGASGHGHDAGAHETAEPPASEAPRPHVHSPVSH